MTDPQKPGKPGQIVYFKTAKLTAKPKSQEIKFQGHGYGVLLGHVPIFAPDPPIQEVWRALGCIGFVSFDDVKELMGDRIFLDLVRKYEDKYYLTERDEDGKLIILPNRNIDKEEN